MPDSSFMPDTGEFSRVTRTMSLEAVGALVDSVCSALSTGNRRFFATTDLPFVGRVYWRDCQRPYVPIALRRRVYARDGFACVRCAATARLSLDHRIARSRGGLDTFENLQTMCMPCNRQKGTSA